MADNGSFASMVAEERKRITRERDKLVSQQQDIQKKIDELNNELHAVDVYEAAKEGKPLPGTSPTRSTGSRRSGIRKEVLALVKATPGGLTAAEVRQRQGIAPDDKSGQQAISNALSALKRTEKLRQDDNGKYVAV